MARKRINPTLSEGLDGDEWERLLADIRGLMFRHGWDKLAQKAGVSPSTIQKLACGDTKSPHLQTVMKIMTAIGKGHLLAQAFRSPKPVSEKEGKKLWKERKKKQ